MTIKALHLFDKECPTGQLHKAAVVATFATEKAAKAFQEAVSVPDMFTQCFNFAEAPALALKYKAMDGNTRYDLGDILDLMGYHADLAETPRKQYRYDQLQLPKE